MTPFDWIAVVGAAAWLPQIGVAIYRFVVKPRVVVVPVTRLEVGYNILGPILNLKATLLAQRKDTIVVDMDITLRHERGKIIRLQWNSFVEKFSDVRSSEGENTEVSRDQEATALKLTSILPTEKFIRFQDADFQEKWRTLTTVANSELTRLKASVPEPANAFLATKAWAELSAFIRHSFPWEAGVYQLELRIQLLERKSPAIARSEFRLTEEEIEWMQKNIPSAITRLEQIARDVPQAELSNVINWANPRLSGKKIMVKT